MKMMEQQKREEALAMYKKNASYQLIESDCEEETTSKAKISSKSKKRRLRSKKESESSEE